MDSADSMAVEGLIKTVYICAKKFIEGGNMSYLISIAIGLVVFFVGTLLTLLSEERKKRPKRMIVSLIASLLVTIAPGLINDGVIGVINTKFKDGSESVATNSAETIIVRETLLVTAPEESGKETTPVESLLKVQLQIGDTVELGSYEQDNNLYNGTEQIEWEVLDIDDDKALLISKLALDCQMYNAADKDTTWETCSVRYWLNGTFYNATFTAEEKERIASVTVTADANPVYQTNAGNTTTDNIFLLSLTELNRYYSYDSERYCRATQYAVAQDAYVNPSTGGSWWLLRTPGISSAYTASVNSDGTIDYDGGKVASSRGVVRPAMWIYLE